MSDFKLLSDVLLEAFRNELSDQLLYSINEAGDTEIEVDYFDLYNAAARLLEKWFLVAHFKEKGFALQTEKSYYQNLQDYYNNLRNTGFEYEDTDFSKAINFMLMSSKTIIINNK